MSLVYLFVPGDSEAKMEKAAASAADVVIIDLEDGVAEGSKAEARKLTYSFLEARLRCGNRSKPIVVRINPASSNHFAEDLRVVRESGADGVMIPKCERAEVVRAVVDAAPQAEPIPLLESAVGVRHVERIAAASERIRKVAFGSVDFALDIGAEWSNDGEERKYAMGQIVLLSRASGLEPPIDAVFPLLHDQEAFIRDAAYGKQIGFYGKMIIHPRHIDWVRNAYKVSEEHLEWCRSAVRLYESSAVAGSVQLDGKLIDLPVYAKAKRVLNAQK